jgi:C-terminal processing protease CtpA/Prc
MALLLTPDRHPINEKGITPDIVVPFTEEDFLQGIDPQLERAIEYLKTGR